MAPRRVFETALVPLALVLASCAGNGGGGNPAIGTPTGLQLTSAPPPPPPVPLSQPALTPTTGGSGTVLPLVITAITPRDFGGDYGTTTLGATLRLDPATGQRFLTINNVALAVSNAPAEPPTWLTDGSGLWVSVNQLDYTFYGNWSLSPLASRDGASSLAAWSGGQATPTQSLPVVGKAEYVGRATGTYNTAICPLCLDYPSVAGDVHLSADFGSLAVSGSMTNMLVGTAGGETPANVYPLNDIGFSASIDSSRNLFVGTTRVTSNPGGRAALALGASGAIAGQFYGPTANEVGATWTISDGTNRIIGSFGAQ